MKWTLPLLFLFSGLAQAQLFKLNVTNCGSLGAACSTFTTALENAVNNDFPDVPNLDVLGEGMSNAAAVATSGNHTSDYTNPVDIIQVGVGVGLAADLGDGSISDLADNPETLGGFGANPSVMVGLNPNFIPVDKIGFIEMDRLRLFGNFFLINYDSNGSGSDAEIDGKIKSFGLRARYHLMDGSGTSLLKWGGLYITTGYQYQSLDLGVNVNVNETGITAGAASGDIAGTAKLSGEVSTHTIPIEISTYAQLAYAFKFYGGLGVDITMGEGKFDFDVHTTVSNVTGAGGYAATGIVNLEGSGKPEVASARAFLGLEFNIPIFKIYVQGNKSLTQDVIGVNTGFKLTW